MRAAGGESGEACQVALAIGLDGEDLWQVVQRRAQHEKRRGKTVRVYIIVYPARELDRQGNEQT